MDSQNVSDLFIIVSSSFLLIKSMQTFYTFPYNQIRFYLQISQFGFCLQKYRNVAAVNSPNSLANMRRQEGELRMMVARLVNQLK